MLSPTPLQTATGGSVVVVVLSLLGMALTAGLSLIVAYRVINGYRRNRSRARLYIALGLVLLTTGPILLQLVLSSLTGVSSVGRALVTTISELLGLMAMLYAIYGVTRSSTPPTEHVESDPSERSEQ